MGRLSETMKRFNKQDSSVGVQLTSMVDVLTILLVFLLKSFSSSAVVPPMGDGVRLPDSTAMVEPIEALKLVVSPLGVFVNDEMVITFQDSKILETDLSGQDPDLIVKLHEKMESEAKRAEEIAKVNPTLDFKGEVLMQADRSLSYEVLRKIMYTSSLAGYGDLKLATMLAE